MVVKKVKTNQIMSLKLLNEKNMKVKTDFCF